MTYSATISSQGQLTIPAKVRRELGITKHVRLDVRNGELIVQRELSLEDIKNILKGPSRPSKLSDREQLLSEGATAKYMASNH
ncbi:AbrB/MazE/SpoVT family DNA-binding domain-containing protein [Candidatus Saccharibacteria bacterium]|nr:MAG: AbrB/MazE/SpoVT family DNA-binding domain-containing protein [Candidatus Saccharibacteria bacterium]